MGDLRTSVIRDRGELEAISAEWDGLLNRSAGAEVFLGYDWMAAWWEVFGNEGGRQPMAVAVRQGRTLVGLAPFVLREVNGPGRARLRRLELMGTGEGKADGVGSSFVDIIAAKGFEEAVCDGVWRWLDQNHASWDEAVFPSVLESSLLARLLRPAARDSGRPSSASRSGRRFSVDLSGGDASAFLEGLSRSKSKRFDIVEERASTREAIPGFLREMSRLDRLRRVGPGGAPAMDSPKFRRFHEILAPKLADKGQLDLRLWKRDGRCVAAHYHFLYGGSVHGYRIGFDPTAFDSLSPGLATIGQSIEWAFANGCRRFDFLVPGDGSHDERHPGKTEYLLDLVVHNRTVGGQLMRFVRQAQGALRDVHARLQAARTILQPDVRVAPTAAPATPAAAEQARPAA